MLRFYSYSPMESMQHKAKTNFILPVIPERMAKSSIMGQTANSGEEGIDELFHYFAQLGAAYKNIEISILDHLFIFGHKSVK